jgi:hypothetical protein
MSVSLTKTHEIVNGVKIPIRKKTLKALEEQEEKEQKAKQDLLDEINEGKKEERERQRAALKEERKKGKGK